MRASPFSIWSRIVLIISLGFTSLFFAEAEDPKDSPTKFRSKRDLLFPGCRNPFCKSSHGKRTEGCDPKPPRVLEVISQPTEDDNGSLDIDVTLLPSPHAIVEFIPPTSPHLSNETGGPAAVPPPLARGANQPQKVKLRYNDSGTSEELLFRAILRNDRGEVFADVTEVVKVNQESISEGAMEERVPVIFENGGRKVVQYMPRSEALQRGLEPVQKPVQQTSNTEEEETE